MATQARAAWPRFARPALQSAALALVLIAILGVQLAPGTVDLNVGEVAPRTIKSPKKVTFVSRIITDAERDRAAASVPDVLDYDPGITGVQLGRLRDTLKRIDDIRRGAGSVEQKREALAKLPDVELSPTAIENLLEFDELSMRATATEALRLLDEVQRQRLSAKDLPAARDSVAARVSSSLIPAEQNAAIELARAFLRPNLAVNEAATALARRQARDAVKPVEVTVEQGETILRDGEVVKPTDLEKLAAAGLRTPAFDWLGLAGSALLMVALVALMAVYIRVFLPEVWRSPRQMALLYLLIAAAALVTKFVAPGRPLLAYALPLAAVPMLVTTLIDPRAAWLGSLVLAVFIGLVGSSPLELATMTLVGGAAGLLSIWRSDRVHRFIRAGFIVGITSFAVVLAFRLINHDLAPTDLVLIAVACAANGFLAAVLTLGTVTLLGHMFGLTTTLGLLELAHPTQPLFQRLLQEAPGTYHHSMMIANLSERAAQAAGADPLLCRVGAYYHDIGKVLRPYFFIENQLNMPNIHNRLDPATSARIIASHVTDGVRLAKEYGLPARVIDIIEQHHGRRFVGPFYWQACQQNPNNPPAESDFRYAGPRPQSKEAAILMLADGVEAAVRASKAQSPERMEAIVSKIISDRIQEGELDDCDLTLRDLTRIKEAFLTVLQGVFHPRIEYPDQAKSPRQGTAAAAPAPAALAAEAPAGAEAVALPAAAPAATTAPGPPSQTGSAPEAPGPLVTGTLAAPTDHASPAIPGSNGAAGPALDSALPADPSRAPGAQGRRPVALDGAGPASSEPAPGLAPPVQPTEARA